jgi:hypothetical protein
MRRGNMTHRRWLRSTRNVLAVTVIASVAAAGFFVAGARSATRPPPMVFSAHQTSAVAVQAIPQATHTIVKLNAETYDPGNDFDTTNSAYRVPKNGRYHFDGRVGVVSPAVPRRIIVSLFVDGVDDPAPAVEVARGQDGTMNGGVSGHNVSDTLSLQEGDLVTLQIWTSATSGDTVDRDPAFITRLSGFKSK